MKAPVLDASAILAFLLDEDGAKPVNELDAFHVSAVNWAEVLQFAPRETSGVLLLAKFRGMGMTLHAFDEEHAARAAVLHRDPVLRRLGFADRACLALAQLLGAPAWTTEKAWTRADAGVTVRCLR